MKPSRAAIVATAGESIARGSKSFAAASRLFGRKTREHSWLLYAWCRACDDLVDGQDHGHALRPAADAQGRLAAMRMMTGRALAGEWVGDPAFDALRIVVAETGIPHRMVWDVIDGFALDVDRWGPRHENDLYRYCYHVAGAVGCMMAVVMGVDPADEETLDRACDLGIALQLANIARDIEEDDRAGRCYLPDDWLTEMDMPPGQHMKPPFRNRLSVLVKRIADIAEEHADSARIGTNRLGFRSAWAVLAATGIYGAIARKIVARGDHAWDHRVTTGPFEKLGWIGKAAWQAAARARLFPSRPRPNSLWTRPRQVPVAEPLPYA